MSILENIENNVYGKFPLKVIDFIPEDTIIYEDNKEMNTYFLARVNEKIVEQNEEAKVQGFTGYNLYLKDLKAYLLKEFSVNEEQSELILKATDKETPSNYITHFNVANRYARNVKSLLDIGAVITK